jgi:hypothetical protein
MHWMQDISAYSWCRRIDSASAAGETGSQDSAKVPKANRGEYGTLLTAGGYNLWYIADGTK